METNQNAKKLFILTSKLRRLLDKKQSKNGLYTGQARILRYIYNNKENTYQKDLESAFQIRGGTVTGMIDGLVKNNLLNRIESNTDKRKRKLVLTENGEQLALMGIETTTRLEESISKLLIEEEQKVLDKIMLKINEWIDQEEDNEKVD